MLTTKALLKLLPYFMGILLLAFVGYKTYTWVYDNGADSVQTKWDAKELKRSDAIAALEEQIEQKEVDHRAETTRISDELSESRLAHETELARIGSDFQRRLRDSETRAGIYQRQSQTGPAQCANLAEHTTRLDSSLEEGRSLVRELRETLGLRERQLISVGQQLMSDRSLLSEVGQIDGK